MAEQLSVALNGERLEIPLRATVADVISALGCGSRGIAVAVNSQIVPRSQWGSVELLEGDRVEVLHAVAGG
jgi:sulfur carrier protein